MKIGVILESFGKDTEQAIELVQKLGIDTIQFYGVDGQLDCDILSDAEKQSFCDYLKSKNIKVSAVCADMGGHGFEYDDNTERIAKTVRVMEFAKLLGCGVVTTHIGVIPKDSCKMRDNMLFAMREIAKSAKNLGIKLAIETGPETCDTLKGFLDEVASEYIGVNFDPANLVMVAGDDPIKGVETLKNYIFHTHAKDGVMVKKYDPRVIYNFFAEGGIGDLRLSDYFLEKPFGQGDVNLKAWVEKLKQVGYDGALTIERETGENPFVDIEIAVSALRELI